MLRYGRILGGRGRWLSRVGPSSPLYFQEARKFVPELQSKGLISKAASGVRAQAWDKDGSLLDDFAVDQVGQVTLLRNAPSPAATSAISIADYVLKEYLKSFPR